MSIKPLLQNSKYLIELENVIPISNLYEKINDLLSEFDVKFMNQYIQIIILNFYSNIKMILLHLKDIQIYF